MYFQEEMDETLYCLKVSTSLIYYGSVGTSK